MGDVNRLVLVVETTKTLLHYWRTILRDYIEKLVRAFCGNKAMNKTGPSIALALVEFNARGSSNFVDAASLVRRSNWTTNVDNFFNWLRGIEFTDADVPDVAIAEGLNEALTSFGLHNQMFPSPNLIQTQQNEGLRNHCILVVANKSDSCLSNAVMVAQSFPQLSVSLSVICPTQLIGIESIYNAGKKNPSAADQTINLVKNSRNLVLISENFKEACDDLSQLGITTEVASLSPVSPGKRKKPDSPDITSFSRRSQISRVNEPPMNWQPVSVGSISSEIDDHSTMDMPDIIYGGTASSVPGAQTVKSFGQSSNTLMTLSAALSVIAQDAAHDSSSSATSTNPGSTSLGIQRPLDVQDYVGMDPFPSVVIQENLPAQQLLQTGTDMNLKTTSAVQSCMPATETMMPPPDTSQTAGTSNAPQAEEEEEEFLDLWEGDLTAIQNGQTVIITKLKGYRSLTDPVTLAEDWPSTMLIDAFLPENFIKNRKNDEKTDFVVFEPMSQDHTLLEKMQRTKDLAVVRLPSQLLLLMPPVEKDNPMTGILLPKDAMAEDISKYLQDQGQVNSWQGPKT
uniref:mediator of RNA polymerase II transcription subunit 25-like n=1 Tax=Erigeron canadensis TaxID=72917 RepID=UPI001CB9776A|nr:mediator of RNA polymerase II transcription subunit 25-like [Erigeron canadensis]